MDRGFHSIKIITEGLMKHVLIDGVPVKGCVHANIDIGIDQVPLVILEIQSTDVQVDVDEAICVEGKRNG